MVFGGHGMWYVGLTMLYADTLMLCHAVTVTFDPLNLNFYSTSSVTYLNSVQNLSEIK